MMPESAQPPARSRNLNGIALNIKEYGSIRRRIEQLDSTVPVALNYIAIRECIAIAIAAAENSVIRQHRLDKPPR